MRSANPLATVGDMARNHIAEPSVLRWPQWLPVALFILCAALVTLAVSVGPFPHDPGRRLFIVCAVCGPIAALRRWPLPVLAAITAVNAMVMAAGNEPLPFGIMLGLASYLVAERLPRRLSIPAAAASAAVLGGALLYVFAATRHAAIPAEAVDGFLPLVAGWFTGDSVAARRRYLAGLAAQAERERAAEAELARLQLHQDRVRIARELHDVVAHTLAVITVQAGVGRRLMAKRPEEASTALASIEAIGRTATEELRVVLGLLRDEDHRTAALAPAPRLADVKDLVETVRASGTPVDLRMSGTDRPFSPALELSVYRVVQEALTNVVKHAPGARATVDLTASNCEIRLDITDDGGPPKPADPQPVEPRGPARAPGSPASGHGIVGMRERITAFGGALVAEPLAGRGFRVTAWVPAEGPA
jgi:signal transduction histidine kinase